MNVKLLRRFGVSSRMVQLFSQNISVLTEGSDSELQGIS